ncbi:MAG: class I SAM-dependent methyltransferase [Phycisphaerae bacterium]|nr:class I SAM-dependent methyltransferase [Phycisphaerae bacterium]MDW8261481.1 class I SAM-dependent methyltransferase [Phycisphaerales bacterium]
MAYAYEDQVHESILRMVPADGKVIGSIGCGPAATEGVLVRQGREVHGVDVAQEVYEIARPRLTSLRIISPDDRTPFAPESLDGLILADVIEHLPAAWDALRQYAQAVRPGGWVIISVPNMRYVEAMARYVLRGDWPEEETGIFDRTHLQFMTHRRLARWIHQAGLTPERWFRRPDPRHPRRSWVLNLLNAGLLGLLSNLLDYQIQVRCRKPKGAAEAR